MERPKRHDRRAGAFIGDVEANRVSKGSVLLVESLDRLTRQQIGDALELFLKLLRLGITIITRTPEQVLDRASINDVPTLFTVIIVFVRANEESELKSKRIGDGWLDLREKVRRGERKIATRHTVPWVRVADGQFEVVDDLADIVRRIFQMALDGMGARTICTTLNHEQVKPIGGKAKYWHEPYIALLLRNRAVIGEYQPKRYRKVWGDAIKNYYPVIIGKKTFDAVAAVLAGRRRSPGKTGKYVTNLFPHLLWDDLGNANYVLKRDNNHTLTIRNAAAVAGAGDGAYNSFNYSALEAALLATLPKIEPADLLPTDNSNLPQKITAAEKRLAGLDKKITTISRRITHEEETDALMNIVVDLDKQRKSAKNELQALQSQQTQPTLLESVKDIQSITWLLRRRLKGTALRETRMKLRLVIGRLVERIGITVEQPDPNRRVKIARCRVRLRSGRERSLWVETRVRGNWRTGKRIETKWRWMGDGEKGGLGVDNAGWMYARKQ